MKQYLIIMLTSFSSFALLFGFYLLFFSGMKPPEQATSIKLYGVLFLFFGFMCLVGLGLISMFL